MAQTPLVEPPTILVVESTEAQPVDGAEALLHLVLSITTEQASTEGNGYSS